MRLRWNGRLAERDDGHPLLYSGDAVDHRWLSARRPRGVRRARSGEGVAVRADASSGGKEEDGALGTPLLDRELSLSPDWGSARAARRFLRSCLEEAGLASRLEDGALAISEVVTNAVLHARTPLEVRLVAYPAHVCVEVSDGDQTPPVQPMPSAEATVGRGLALVAAVSLSYGVRSLGAAGKVVWFCIGDPPGHGTDRAAGWAVRR